jgi:hypothetical protein
MYHMQYKISFRVSAPIGINQGLYYINWSITETRLEGSPDDLYDAPIKTLLEIYPRNKATFTVEPI